MTAPRLDTSFVVRYFMRDPPDAGQRAAQIIDGGVDVGIGSVVLAETAHVLKSVYRIPREQIVDALIALVEKETIQPLHLDRSVLVEALRLCRPSGRVSVPDALLWAEARSSGAYAVYTFDRQFPSDGIRVLSSADDAAGASSDDGTAGATGGAT